MKKTKLILAVIAFAILTVNCFAQTSVPGGNISGHWTTGGSPYNIMASVKIPNGSTLIIDPGVTVSFQTGSNPKMVVHGQILAVGTASQNIIITAADTTHGFGGFQFDTLAGNNDTSKFIYCNIKYGKGNSVNSTGGALYFKGWNKTAVISHCTISHCISAGTGTYCGGAITCIGTSPIITYNTIFDNTSNFNNPNYGGGAIFLENSTNAVISNNTFSNNTASYAGAIYSKNNTNALISYNIISNNNGGYHGGGIKCYQGTTSITNNTISNNQASSGGGIYCWYGTIKSISHNIISGNLANASGGGICTSTGAIIDSIDNTIITNNSANGNGGAIYFTGYAGNITTVITNVTIANNNALHGGGIYCTAVSNPRLHNCILWGNTATLGAQLYLDDESSDPPFYYCEVQGGVAAFELNGNFYTGAYTNNINSDPLFIAPSAGSGSTYNGTYDWTLQAASPCINTGAPSGTYPATDLAGAARVFGGNIDMGAYEYHHVSVTVSHTDLACHGGNNATATATPAGYVPTCTYLWSNGQTTQTVTGLTAGTYSVTVTDGSSDTASASVTITQPAAIIVNAGVNDTICIAGNTSIGGSPTASGGTGTLTYAWSPSTSLSSSSIANPIATPSSTTTYTVIVTDGNSCANTASVIITVIPHPGTAATPSGTTTLCQGSPNTTYLTAGTSNATSYQWNITPSGAGTISGTSTTGIVTWNAAYSGTAKIKVKGINSCSNGTSSDSLTVTINPTPTVNVSSFPGFIEYNTPPLTLSGNPTGGTFSGTSVSGNSFNPAVAGLGTHHITYSYTNSNSCSNTSVATTIVYDTTGVLCTSYDTISVTDTLFINAVLTGINPPNNVTTIKIYPNPANTNIYINIGNYASMTGYTIKISNSLGQTFYTTPVTQQLYNINLSTWSGKGIYFVYLIDASNNIIDIKKIVLQ